MERKRKKGKGRAGKAFEMKQSKGQERKGKEWKRLGRMGKKAQ